jgi:probable lipoprotein NlpC
MTNLAKFAKSGSLVATHWSAKYIGLPYHDLGRDMNGCDCWGLVRIAYNLELGIELPAFDGYGSSDDVAAVNGVLAEQLVSDLCLPVIKGQEREFDVVVFRRGRLDSHVGIVVSPGQMLHIAEKDQARIEGYSEGYWAARLTGIVRHIEMALV